MPLPPSLEVALQRLVACELPDANEALRARLVREHATALAHPPDGGQCIAVLEEGAAAVAVLEPARPRAWLLGLCPDPERDPVRAARALHELEQALSAHGQSVRLLTAGPPAGYLRSGLDVRRTELLAWWQSRGYRPVMEHVDLVADLAPPEAPDPRVRRAGTDEGAALIRWIEREFSAAWASEAAAALTAHDAVFVAGSAPEYAGFCGHSGHNAAAGTFGPLGVARSARGSGLGGALARAALDDLYARGFQQVTIPWVDPARVAFYRRLVPQVQIVPRVVFAKSVGQSGP
jgi:GNAT superfamily N-acetyltransferase